MNLSIRRPSRWLLCAMFAATASLGACDRPAEDRLADEARWRSQDAETQVGELRDEMLRLRDQVGQLQAQVERLEGGLARIKVDQANAPAGGKLPGVVELGDAILQGSPEAKLAIIEFTDYECPFCARHARETFPRIKSELIETGLVRYGVRDFPIPSHANARDAAIAARCAGRQGRYWDMHAALFEHRKNLGDGLYRRLGGELGLDSAAFASCLVDPSVGAAVDADLAYGRGIGVTGTPKFFVGRLEGQTLVDVVLIPGAMPYAAFADAVSQLRTP